MRPQRTIEGIQVLRAIAALMVVGFHARFSVIGTQDWFRWGSSGVDIFFVISGFVMPYTTRQVTKESIEERLAEAGLFLRKRIARIVPLYWLALLWTTRRTAPDINLLKDFLFVARWQSPGSNIICPLVVQGWTLNYEMLFYLLFALAMLFGAARIVVVVGLLLLTWLATGWLTNSPIVSQFYGNQIILEFGLGILLYWCVVQFDLPSWPRWTFVGIMAIGFYLLSIGTDVDHRFVRWGLPALLIVWASFKGCEGWLRWRALALLGDASYAIYIFHWTSFGILKPLAATIGPEHVVALVLLHIVVATAAGVVIHLLIEKPLTRWVQIALKTFNARSASRAAG